MHAFLITVMNNDHDDVTDETTRNKSQNLL